MTGTKAKKTSSVSELAYLRTFGYSPREIRIPGQTDNLQSSFLYPGYDDFTLEHEAIQRKKLYSALQIAKQNNDQIMINKIELELGIKKEPDKDAKDNEEIKEVLKVLRQKLVDSSLSDEEHNRVIKSIAALSLGSTGSMAAIAALTSTSNKPVEPKKDVVAELMTDLVKDIIKSKTNESKESDFDKFLRYKKAIDENTPDPLAMFKDAKETLKTLGVDTDGSKNLQVLQLQLEEKKLDNENTFKMKELDVKQETTKTFGDWIKGLSTAVIESAIDSMGDEETETKEKKTEKSTDIEEMKIRCFGCTKLFKIADFDKTREVVCDKCSWPHSWDGEKHKATSFIPSDVKEKMGQEPEEFVKNYQEGQLTEMLEGQNEEKV